MPIEACYTDDGDIGLRWGTNGTCYAIGSSPESLDDALDRVREQAAAIEANRSVDEDAPELSADLVGAINKILEAHNATMVEEYRATTCDTLRIVAARGLADWASEERQDATPTQWALGRVRQHLYLLSHDRPRKRHRSPDWDLLPLTHPAYRAYIATTETREHDAPHRPLVGPKHPRTLLADLEVNKINEDEDGTYQIRGHAAVFDADSRPLSDGRGGQFIERIARGAFRRALTRSDLDVVLLINHDNDKILARTSNGTLRLQEDPTGLAVEADVAATSYASDLRVLLERGDITQMSFGFDIERDRWWQAEDGTVRRDVLDVATLWDVSVVTMPAYPDTVVQVRETDTPEVSEAHKGSEPGAAAVSLKRRRLDLSVRGVTTTPQEEKPTT
jgi:HK97 family phage prohead protease